VRPSKSLPRTCSGDIEEMVPKPHRGWSVILERRRCPPCAVMIPNFPRIGIKLAKPKIKDLACTRMVMKNVRWLMSRWMIPLAWAASRASAISIASDKINSFSSGLPAIRCFQCDAIQKLHDDGKDWAVMAANLWIVRCWDGSARRRLRLALQTR